MANSESRSSIGLRRSTKARLDRSRAPGQCYDGFLCQLVDMWEETHEGHTAGQAGSRSIRYQSVR